MAAHPGDKAYDDAETTRLRTIIAPIVENAQLYLEDVNISVAGTERTVHVVVDLPEDQTGGVSLDAIAELSHQLGDAIDDQTDARPYTLDVSSPGLSRPLTEPRQWKRNLGRIIKVKLHHSEVVVGRLQEVGEDAVVLVPDLPRKKGMKPKTGDPVRIKYSDIKRATVEVDFSQSAAGEEA